MASAFLFLVKDKRLSFKPQTILPEPGIGCQALKLWRFQFKEGIEIFKPLN
jgi:hypothetical protein